MEVVKLSLVTGLRSELFTIIFFTRTVFLYDNTSCRQRYLNMYIVQVNNSVM